MAFLGLRTKDAGLGASSTVDMLVKALTGDPEREMALARGRADLDLNAYRQRQMEASAAHAQAAAAQAQADADTKAWELNQRTTNLPIMEKYLAGLVDEPAPVTTPGALPAPAPGLPDPVAVAEPMPAPEAAFTPRSTMFQSGADVPGFTANPPMPIPQGATPLLPLEPVAVEDFTTGPELQLDEDTLQLPQPDMLPGEVVPPSPEEMAAYERERDAAKARAGLIIGGGGNAEQMGKGLGIGEGAVMSGSDDPEMRRRAELLYAGKTAGESGSDLAKVAEVLRKEYVANPSVKNFEDAFATLQGVEQAAKDNTGASDVAFMYGVMKAFDPGVSVQEGDKANAQNAMNVPARVWLMYNNAVDGKSDMFTPEVRADFIKAVRGQVQGRRAQAERWMENYKTKARQQNVPPEWVVFDIPEVDESPVETEYEVGRVYPFTIDGQKVTAEYLGGPKEDESSWRQVAAQPEGQ